MRSTLLIATLQLTIIATRCIDVMPFCPVASNSSPSTSRRGWLENFFEPNKSTDPQSSSQRQLEYPEQYPAAYEPYSGTIPEDDDKYARLVRPLLKNTQLQSRSLQLAYDANRDGWNPQAFHQAVDGKGAAIAIAKIKGDGKIVGGYNPKGWASLGGARPSVAAFVFYETTDATAPIATTSYDGTKVAIQKLRKVGGGGLACAQDDPTYGVSFGPDGLVIPLQAGRERSAQSKLGPYFERGPEDRSSVLGSSAGAATTQLQDLFVLVGTYKSGEDIPYSGGVLDMTSG